MPSNSTLCLAFATYHPDKAKSGVFTLVIGNTYPFAVAIDGKKGEILTKTESAGRLTSSLCPGSSDAGHISFTSHKSLEKKLGTDNYVVVASDGIADSSRPSDKQLVQRIAWLQKQAHDLQCKEGYAHTYCSANMNDNTLNDDVIVATGPNPTSDAAQFVIGATDGVSLNSWRGGPYYSEAERTAAMIMHAIKDEITSGFPHIDRHTTPLQNPWDADWKKATDTILGNEPRNWRGLMRNNNIAEIPGRYF